MREGYNESYEDVITFFNNKLKNLDEHIYFLEEIYHAKGCGLEHEVFILAYSYYEENCCQAINGAMMEWGI